MLAPPGFYLDNATYYYHADTFRDENGDRLPFNVELNVIANRTSALWVSAWTLLHATYGAGIAFPVSNFAPNPISIEGESADGSLGLGDIAVQPFIFGWHFRQFHYLASFTLFTPTGRFKQGATNNTGKGFWTNMLSAGATWVSPDSAPWSISAIGRYEIPTKQEGADIYPGQTATDRMGFGKAGSRTLSNWERLDIFGAKRLSRADQMHLPADTRRWLLVPSVNTTSAAI